jgi:hypothetical protein
MIRAFLLGWSLGWAAAAALLVIVAALSGIGQREPETDDVEPWVAEALR